MTFHNRKVSVFFCKPTFFFLHSHFRPFSSTFLREKPFLLSSPSTQTPAWPHSVIPFHRIAHCSFGLLWFVVFLHIWDKAKSNWRNKSELSERCRGCPALKVGLFQMSKLLYSLHPSVKRVRMESSRRGAQRCTLRSCITGCRNDEVVRGCLSRHHPLQLLYSSRLAFAVCPYSLRCYQSLWCKLLELLKNLFIFLACLTACETLNNHLQFFSPVFPSWFHFMSHCSLLLAVGLFKEAC